MGPNAGMARQIGVDTAPSGGFFDAVAVRRELAREAEADAYVFRLIAFSPAAMRTITRQREPFHKPWPAGWRP